MAAVSSRLTASLSERGPGASKFSARALLVYGRAFWGAVTAAATAVATAAGEVDATRLTKPWGYSFMAGSLQGWVAKEEEHWKRRGRFFFETTREVLQARTRLAVA